MKICCISDTHTAHGQITIPECDVLIHSGDACGHGTMVEFASFANWISNLDQAKRKIYVPGNHDRFVEDDTLMAESMLGPSVDLLINQSVEVGDIVIHGIPHTPAFCNWAFQANDTRDYDSPRYLDMDYYLSMIPDTTTILVSHGPPMHVLDRAWAGSEPLGSLAMYKAIDNGTLKPKAMVFGHIHESFGHIRYEGIDFFNVAMQKGGFTMRTEPVTFHIENGQVIR